MEKKGFIKQMFLLNGNTFPPRRKKETPKAQELMKHSRLRKLKKHMRLRKHRKHIRFRKLRTFQESQDPSPWL